MRDFYRAAVGYWGIQPSEFWDMTPQEWWWLAEAKADAHTTPEVLTHEDVAEAQAFAAEFDAKARKR